MTAIMNIYRMSNNTLQVEIVCRHLSYLFDLLFGDHFCLTC